MEDLSTILILKTKLQIPDLPSDYIFRPHLIEYLNKEIRRPLTLISAGAGYGKSTFVSSWFKGIKHNKTWVSLDSSDNDIREFISYFIYGIKERIPEFGKHTIPLISGPYIPDINTITKSLINELNQLEELFILALDDLYFIKSMEIYQLISTLLNHPPSNFHLVLITRIDPPIPLSKLRSNKKMKDIRVSQLKFSDTDVKNFLNSNIEICKSDMNNIAKILTSKVDGWITGLRLALLQMSFINLNKRNIEEVFSEMNFSEHYIIDEIINQIDKDILDFLIKTSALKRINSAQISFIFEDEDINKTDQIIRDLVKNNLFIINLDNEHNWYRYHHLLHSFLQKQLKKKYPADYINKIHIKAAEWYEKEAMIEDAFYHTTQLGSYKFSVGLIERNMYDPLNEDKWYVLNEWLKKIPRENILKSPDLIIAQLWVSQHKNRIWEIPKLLERLKSFKNIDEQLRSQIAFFDGFMLFWGGCIDKSIVSFKKALENLPKDKVGAISLSKIYYAIALQMKGEGERIFKEIEVELYDNQLNNTYRIILYSTLLFIRLLDGRLNEAEQINRKLRKLSTQNNDHLIQTWTTYLLGYIAYFRNELNEAEHRFKEAIQNIHFLNTTVPVDCYAGLLITQKALGKIVDYEHTYKQMNEWTDQRNNPIFTNVAFSLRARLALCDNNIEQGVKYLDQSNLDLDTGITLFWIEHPRITECRVLIAQNTEEPIRKAIQKLDLHYKFAVSTHNKVLEMKSLIWLSIALNKMNNSEKALEYLLKALSFSIPNSFKRIIIENGHDLLPLLIEIEPHFKYSQQVSELIVEINTLQRIPDVLQKSKRLATTSDNNIYLSNREIEVAGYLSKRYTNKEIANMLFISEATVKRHTINIYQKLGVNKRRDAVIKAQELGLLS
jgi:LuxR family maltose regulon positive regulatory protein